MKLTDLTQGNKHKVFDDEDCSWCLCKVKEIKMDKVIMIDVSGGEWDGIEFDISEEELNDSEYFNTTIYR